MIAVSDTTPLISLMKTGHLDILQSYFGEIQIPEVVFAELTSNPRFAEEAEQIRHCSFIKVVTVADVKSVALIRRATGLDLGESEAIVLSDSLHADLLLMDEAQTKWVEESNQEFDKAMARYIYVARKPDMHAGTGRNVCESGREFHGGNEYLPKTQSLTVPCIDHIVENMNGRDKRRNFSVSVIKK